MRLKWFVLTAGLVTALQPGVALAGVTTNIATLVTNSSPQSAGRLAPSPQLRYPNLFESSTSTFRRPQFRFNLPAAVAKGPASNLPTPGVYTTEPYACIVVVPGRHPDDKMAVGMTDKTPMPIIKPELRFNPRPPK